MHFLIPFTLHFDVHCWAPSLCTSLVIIRWSQKGRHPPKHPGHRSRCAVKLNWCNSILPKGVWYGCWVLNSFFFFLTLQTHSYCTAWLTNVDIAFLPPKKSSERAQKNWKTFAHIPPWGDLFRLVVRSECRDVTSVLFLTIPVLSCLLQDSHTGIQISKDLPQYQVF